MIVDREVAGETSERLSLIVGLAAVVFTVLYFVSDVLEHADGGFSTPQLSLTLAAEAAIPLFVIGLYVVQRARMGCSASSARSVTRTVSCSSRAQWCTRS
jgi:hypothetical protein